MDILLFGVFLSKHPTAGGSNENANREPQKHVKRLTLTAKICSKHNTMLQGLAHTWYIPTWIFLKLSCILLKIIFYTSYSLTVSVYDGSLPRH